MTRINLVPVSELCDAHLLAEHREIKRIPNCILNNKVKLDGNYGEQYTLGKGHVRFFYNKLPWLFLRYGDIHAECLRRGFNVKNYSPVFSEAYNKAINIQIVWWPMKEDVELSRARINEKLAKMKNKKWTVVK